MDSSTGAITGGRLNLDVSVDLKLAWAPHGHNLGTEPKSVVFGRLGRRSKKGKWPALEDSNLWPSPPEGNQVSDLESILKTKIGLNRCFI